MSCFVLVHGGMHGSWCWEKIVPRLGALGHRAITPDLPGMAAGDRTPPTSVTLAMQAETVAEAVDAAGEPVVLVGHSMGGIAISEAAERVPELLSGLVYLSAMLVPAGETMFGWVRHREQPFRGVGLSDDGALLVADPDRSPGVFYNTCGRDDVDRAVACLRPQPTKPGNEPLTVTTARFGSVPRAYVECLRDNAQPLAFQRFMQAALPCEPVFTLDTDHSPFFSAPDALTGHLVAAAVAFDRRAPISAAPIPDAMVAQPPA